MDEVPGGGCKDVPNHIAIIMDGNGRWAQKRHLPAAAGHRAGAKKVREISEACVQHDIRNLTLFAFSTENWQRPDKEVGGLMDLIKSQRRGKLRWPVGHCASGQKNNDKIRPRILGLSRNF